MSRSPRAWWRAPCAGALILLATAGPALVAAGSASGDPGPLPEASFVVARARFEPLDGSRPLGVDGLGDYSGSIEVVPNGGGLAVVNDVGVEDYVAGISEVPSEWPPAALEAQAIAARSYLLHNVVAPSPALAAVGAQICASQDCQVYRGLAKIRAPFGRAWLDSVRATAGQVLLYNGRPINAMYSSSNGGHTVAGGEPYLPAVADPDDTEAPLDRWTVDVGLTDLAHALHMPGTVTSISRSVDTVSVNSAEARSDSAPPGGATPSAAPSPTPSPAPSGAAASAPATTLLPQSSSTTSTVAPEPPVGPTTTSTAAPTTTSTGAPAPGATTGGAQGSLTLTASEFTRRVNGALPPAEGRDVLLPSDRFTVTQNPSTATFAGGGFGHGVGMSQYGALAKARRGLSAADILAFYYGGLRPTLLPMSAVPATVRVDLADGLASTTVTGRFRLVDEHDNVLITVGDGPWRVEQAPGGRVRVVLPDAYHSAFGVAPVIVEPAVVVPGAKLAVHFSLPVPGLTSVSAEPPGAPPVTTDLGITTPGPHRVELPPAAGPGTYTLHIAAAAGAGRQADSVLEIDVATSALAAPSGSRATPGSAPIRPRPRRASMTAGILVAVVLLFAVTAVVGTALLRPNRSL